MTSIPSTSFSSLPHFPFKSTGWWINTLSLYLAFFSYSKPSSSFGGYWEKWQYLGLCEEMRSRAVVGAAAVGLPYCCVLPKPPPVGYLAFPDLWWERISPQGRVRMGWIFLPNTRKNSCLSPKDWRRLDPDQIFRFDTDSTDYLPVNILTGVGHLAM